MMQNRVRLWTLLSFFLAPFTLWTCHQTWLLATASTTSPNSGKSVRLAAYAVTLALLNTQLSFFRKLRFELRARRQGCKPAALFPHSEYIIGLGWFLDSARALASGTLLDLFIARFRAVGNTHYSLALGKWILMTNEPENVKAILASDFESFPIAGPRLWAVLPQLGPRSIFTTNGQAWHAARSMIRPSFVRDQVADLACFDRHTGNLIAAIRALQTGEKSGEASPTFDLQKLLLLMTMDSSTDFMLGHSTESLTRGTTSQAKEFLSAFDHVSFEGAKRSRLGPGLMFLIPPGKRFTEGVKTIRSFVRRYVDQAIEEKRKREKRGEAQKRSYVFLDELIESGADEEYVLDQVLSIIIAGRDTTAGAMSALFYYIARSPGTVEKLRREIEDLGVRDPSWEDLKGMKYLQNVIKEALRLFPPVATNSRCTNKEVVLPRGGGPDGKSPMLVPEGMAIRWSSFSIQRREDIFGKDAAEFRPERWENLRVAWEYLPFSGGPRICIGQQFALTQISYTLFRVVQNFKSIEARDPDPLRVKVSTTSTLYNGCLVSMTPV